MQAGIAGGGQGLRHMVVGHVFVGGNGQYCFGVAAGGLLQAGLQLRQAFGLFAQPVAAVFADAQAQRLLRRWLIFLGGGHRQL